MVRAWCAACSFRWNLIKSIIKSNSLRELHKRVFNQLQTSSRWCSCATPQRKWCYFKMMLIWARISLAQMLCAFLHPHILSLHLLWVRLGSVVMRKRAMTHKRITSAIDDCCSPPSFGWTNFVWFNNRVFIIVAEAFKIIFYYTLAVYTSSQLTTVTTNNNKNKWFALL